MALAHKIGNSTLRSSATSTPILVRSSWSPRTSRACFSTCSEMAFAANKRRQDGKAGADYHPVLRVTTHDLGDKVEVRVRDNGVGVPTDVLAKIFTPFFTTKPTGEGTGLGLSISYEIVTQQHGGTITVESRVNEFTEFVI